LSQKDRQNRRRKLERERAKLGLCVVCGLSLNSILTSAWAGRNRKCSDYLGKKRIESAIRVELRRSQGICDKCGKTTQRLVGLDADLAWITTGEEICELGMKCFPHMVDTNVFVARKIISGYCKLIISTMTVQTIWRV
jgi:hypothetical protein